MGGHKTNDEVNGQPDIIINRDSLAGKVIGKKKADQAVHAPTAHLAVPVVFIGLCKQLHTRTNLNNEDGRVTALFDLRQMYVVKGWQGTENRLFLQQKTHPVVKIPYVPLIF